MTASGEKIQTTYDHASLCVYDAFDVASKKYETDEEWISWVGYFAAVDAPSVEYQLDQLNKAIINVIDTEAENEDPIKHLYNVRSITKNIIDMLDNDDVRKVDKDEAGMYDIIEGVMEFKNLLDMVNARILS